MANFYLIEQDLFKMPQGYCLAHCISADCALGAGIAVEFDRNFNMKEKLLNQLAKTSKFYTGDVIKIDNVYNLVTKEQCFLKPTYEDFQNTIKNFVDQLKEDKVTKIAIPKIGAGLDKLKWSIVLAILQDAFKDTDIDVIVCFLGDDPDYLGYNTKISV